MQICLRRSLSSLPRLEKALNLSDFSAALNRSEIRHESSVFILLLLHLIRAEMAFVLAQAIWKNPSDARCNGLGPLRLPLEQSEDLQSAFSFAQRPVSVRSMSAGRGWFYGTPASDADALQSPDWLRRALSDHKKMNFPAESTGNELSLRRSYESFSVTAAEI